MSMKFLAWALRPLFGLLLVAAFATQAHSQSPHLRFGHTTWKRVASNSDGSIRVEFTSMQAWRSSALDMLSLDFGDGTSFAPTSSDISDIASATDLAGRSYTIRRFIVQHTYAAADIVAQAGQFLAVTTGCCRISNLINASGAAERIETLVDLNGNNEGSAISNAPVVLQFKVAQDNSFALAVSDPAGDPITCRLASPAESFIPSPAQAGGVALSVSPDCVVSWNLSATGSFAVGRKYAVQIVMEESNHCIGAACGKVALDFIVELVQGNPPQCSSDTPLNNSLYVNVPFATRFTAIDPDPGAMLALSAFGIPSTSGFTPDLGSVQASPFSARFDWTPREADRGSAQSFLVSFRDQGGLQSVCAMSLQVSKEDPVVSCTQIEVTNHLLTLDGNALAQRDFAKSLARTLYRLRGATKSEYKSLLKEADKLYVQAWSQAWMIPSSLLNCGTSEFCSTIPTATLSGPYIISVLQLDALSNSILNRVKATGLSKKIKRLKRTGKAVVSASTSAAANLPPTQSSCPGAKVVVLEHL